MSDGSETRTRDCSRPPEPGDRLPADRRSHRGAWPVWRSARPIEANQISDDIWHLASHNSTALECNTLALREVAILLQHGRAVGAKALTSEGAYQRRRFKRDR